MQYAKDLWMSYHIQSHFVVCKLTAILAILTHSPLRSARYVTSAELKTDDSLKQPYNLEVKTAHIAN